MAKGQNQKLKLLYLINIFNEKTDEEHSITMPEILSSLEAYGINAERKSIYDDIETLRGFGLDIIGEQRERKFFYHMGERQFEIAELKLLVDSVQSSKFITAKKSAELIRKIESFASKYDAKKLQRQVYVNGRIKTMNESIYYNVDEINTAISQNKQIRFHYFMWNVDKKMELRKNGDYYTISPWSLSWDDENYYLIGFDSTASKIKHFRVDKMKDIELIEQLREGRDIFEKCDMAAYSNKVFGMFEGKEETVKLELENHFAGVIIDRFGKDVSLVKKDSEHFTVNVNVQLSNQFFGWVFALGDGVKIVGPETVVDQMKAEIKKQLEKYK